jgi:hypothetical protein
MSGRINDNAFFVDIERRYENTYWGGRYEWELREGTMDSAALVSEREISNHGTSWTLLGARWAAKRAKRKVLHSRRARYLPREVVR